MCKKKRIAKEKKAYILRRGKRGFTLVELSVVLALLAILATMTVTFSTFMNGIAAKNQAEYDFYADSTTLKDELRVFLAEKDVQGGVLSIAEDGRLVATVDGEESHVTFKNNRLFFGETESQERFEAIDGISFETCEKLVKCVTFCEINGECFENSFVLSLRASQIEEVSENA